MNLDQLRSKSSDVCKAESDESWDYRAANTKEYTHCFHAYPARMIPQIARELLKRYGAEGEWLLDPYCGTGTSLVEASLFGMRSVGCDINPLARLIAQVKTAPLPLDILDPHLDRLNGALLQVGFSRSVPERPAPPVTNLEYWFSEEAVHRLAYLRGEIQNIEEEPVRNFLWVAFSETVRECSYTRTGEFKLHRIPALKMEGFSPDVFGLFCKKMYRNRDGMAAYLEKRKQVETFVSSANTAHGEPPKPLPPGGFALALTSPPYGDSQTTVAYGQFSRLASEWIGYKNARNVDKTSMGGQTPAHASRRLTPDRRGALPPDSPVAASIEKIGAVDSKRAGQVSAFYADLDASIGAVAKALSPRATACYVVGNRAVKGETLPTDAFIVSAFQKRGFRHKETIVRNIPNKRMPRRNSPTNIPGKTAATMNEEYIVVCQKETRETSI